jgi:hypothetical protein
MGCDAMLHFHSFGWFLHAFWNETHTAASLMRLQQQTTIIDKTSTGINNLVAIPAMIQAYRCIQLGIITRPHPQPPPPVTTIIAIVHSNDTSRVLGDQKRNLDGN